MQLKFFMPVLMCLWVLQLSSASTGMASEAVMDKLGHQLSLPKTKLTEILSDIENFKNHLKLSTHDKFNVLARESLKIVHSHAAATHRQTSDKAHESRGKRLNLRVSKQCVHHGDSIIAAAISSAESELSKCKHISLEEIEDYVRELDAAYNNGTMLMLELDMVFPMCNAEDEHIEQEECFGAFLMELNKSIEEFESGVSSLKSNAEKEEQKILSTLTRCNAEAVSGAKSRIVNAEHSASSCLHN